MNERSICREPDVPAGRELQSAVEHQERPDANVQQFSKVQGSQRRRFVDTHHNIIMLNTHTKRRKWTFEGNARNGNIIEKWKRIRSKAVFGTKIASSSCPNVVFFIIDLLRDRMVRSSCCTRRLLLSWDIPNFVRSRPAPVSQRPTPFPVCVILIRDQELGCAGHLTIHRFPFITDDLAFGCRVRFLFSFFCSSAATGGFSDQILRVFFCFFFRIVSQRSQPKPPAAEPVAGSGIEPGPRLHLGPRRDHHHLPLAAHRQLCRSLRKG